MKSLNENIYQRLLLQAKEAKELGFEKLAEGVLSSMAPNPADENEVRTYSSIELENDIYQKLWKVAMDVIAYYDLNRVDIQKIDDTLSFLTTAVLSNVEASLGVEDMIGPLEPKLPGQNK